MTFLNEAQSFLEKAEASIPLEYRSPQQVDHLCYRADTVETYKTICKQASKVAHFLTESDVNGRPISCFYVPQGLSASQNTVHVIEIASPKQGTRHKLGFEHIEIFSDKPVDKGLLIDDVRIKFCKESLLRVVQQERWEKYQHLFTSPMANIFSLSAKSGDLLAAVHDSRVLDVLQEFHPKICGTYPLGIALSKSDIDIVCQAASLASFSVLLQKHFQKFNGFKISKDNGHITCQFRCRDILIEIYATDIPSTKQRGYVHMLTEAQLLSYCGDWSRDEIIKLKKSGLKTEPAFATFFNIAGDSYEELYTLYNNIEKIESLAKKCLSRPIL